jgi:hypothetical protein
MPTNAAVRSEKRAPRGRRRTPVSCAPPRAVAQLAEHRSPKPGVAGSSPAGPVRLSKPNPAALHRRRPSLEPSARQVFRRFARWRSSPQVGEAGTLGSAAAASVEPSCPRGEVRLSRPHDQPSAAVPETLSENRVETARAAPTGRTASCGETGNVALSWVPPTIPDVARSRELDVWRGGPVAPGLSASLRPGPDTRRET